MWKSWALFHRHVETFIRGFKNPAKAPLTVLLIISDPSTVYTSLETPYSTWPPITSSMTFFGHQLVELRGHLATSKRFAKTVVFPGSKKHGLAVGTCQGANYQTGNSSSNPDVSLVSGKVRAHPSKKSSPKKSSNWKETWSEPNLRVWDSKCSFSMM